MANALSVNNCSLCQIPMGNDGNQPGVVKCAHGHAFHRQCLIGPDNVYLRCPESQCGEQFTCISKKSLMDRMARAAIIGIDVIDFYEEAVTMLSGRLDITSVYAGVILAESDFFKEFIKKLPREFLEIMVSRDGLFLAGAILYYGWPFLIDYIQQQFYSGDVPQETEVEALVLVP